MAAIHFGPVDPVNDNPISTRRKIGLRGTRYTVSNSMNKEGFPEIDEPRPFTVEEAEKASKEANEEKHEE